MSDNEKLRALLVGARQWVGGWNGILPVGVAEFDSLRSRIDAALAEPVATCGACGRHDQPHDPCDCAGEGEK